MDVPNGVKYPSTVKNLKLEIWKRSGRISGRVFEGFCGNNGDVNCAQNGSHHAKHDCLAVAM